VAAWPLAVWAQQARNNRKLGVLHPGQAAAVNSRLTAIREGLNDAGHQRDSGIELVTRLADGDLSRLPALAENLVNTRVDAILAAAPPAVQAASGATKSIPVIALDLESDPVASGFIASLARPGGNVTGVFLDFPEFSAKCLQMLIETLSGCFSSGLTRSGLYRGPRCGDRIPLGGGSTQSIARARGRFGAPSREHDCRGRRLLLRWRLRQQVRPFQSSS
jgi:ABC transporter substrate binding protein